MEPCFFLKSSGVYEQKFDFFLTWGGLGTSLALQFLTIYCFIFCCSNRDEKYIVLQRKSFFCKIP